MKGLVFLTVTAKDILKGGGNEEVLLLQPEFLALTDIVAGVQHLEMVST